MLCDEVKEDTYFVKNGDNWQLDYTSLHFTDADTGISMVQWVNNQRLMLGLSENDYGTQAENKVNVNVPADKLAATNMLEKILVNGTSLKDLGVTSADLNYWTYWGRVSVALSGIEVQTITIEEGCQFPSMAFAESGTPSRYVTKESVTYYAVGEADGDVLNCKKSANVTFDGQVVTAYVGMAIPADVVPANPTKESDEYYHYTFDGWYNGETKWNLDSDVVTGDIALTSQFTETARTYTLTVDVNGETTTQELTYRAEIILETPEIAGKTFVRWYVLDAENTAINAPTTMPAEAVKLYAEWTLNTYTVTFVGCEGVEAITFTVENISEVVFPEVPAKEGYTAAWDKTEEDLTLSDLTVTAVYTEIPVTSDSDTSDTSDTTSDTTGETPTEKPVKQGCRSVASAVGVAGILTFVGAAIALKKKKED